MRGTRLCGTGFGRGALMGHVFQDARHILVMREMARRIQSRRRHARRARQMK
jgi:hypothetical protein